MAITNPYVEYQNVRYSTVSRGNLLLIVYDGAVNFLEEAKNRMIIKDFSGRGLYIDRAFGAINEMRNSLNYEVDDKLAGSLNQLYFFMTKQLSRASLENDVEAVEIVIALLKGLREVWKEAVKKDSIPQTAKERV
ncbi:MAG: flagellar export chaperone FliS [candidate division Zixibacteria bacterium]|nr:flagellar export chaperone FliS [Candidatus Tariuqbacter arcticus]